MESERLIQSVHIQLWQETFLFPPVPDVDPRRLPIAWVLHGDDQHDPTKPHALKLSGIHVVSLTSLPMNSMLDNLYFV